MITTTNNSVMTTITNNKSSSHGSYCGNHQELDSSLQTRLTPSWATLFPQALPTQSLPVLPLAGVAPSLWHRLPPQVPLWALNGRPACLPFQPRTQVFSASRALQSELLRDWGRQVVSSLHLAGPILLWKQLPGLSLQSRQGSHT